jgi:hypothetical protein
LPLSYTKRVSLLAYALILRYINSFENTNIFCLLPCEVSTKSLFLHCICYLCEAWSAVEKKYLLTLSCVQNLCTPITLMLPLAHHIFFFVFPLIFFCQCYNKWCHWFIFDIYAHLYLLWFRKMVILILLLKKKRYVLSMI